MPNCGICRPGGSQSKNQRKITGDKYLDIAKELKRLWNLKVTVIPIVIGVLGMIPQDLVRGLEEFKIGG